MGLQLCTLIVCLSRPFLFPSTEHWNLLHRPATAANWCLPARAYQPPPASPYLHAPQAAYLLPLTCPCLPARTYCHCLPHPSYLPLSTCTELPAHQILASWSCWMPAAWLILCNAGRVSGFRKFFRYPRSLGFRVQYDDGSSPVKPRDSWSCGHWEEGSTQGG